MDYGHECVFANCRRKTGPWSSCGVYTRQAVPLKKRPSRADSLLTTLPPEIMSNITQHLQDHAVLALLQTCRKLRTAFGYHQTQILNHYATERPQCLDQLSRVRIFSSLQSLSVVEQLAFLELLERDDPARLACCFCIARHQRSFFSSDVSKFPAKKRICMRQKRNYEIETEGYNSRFGVSESPAATRDITSVFRPPSSAH